MSNQASEALESKLNTIIFARFYDIPDKQRSTIVKNLSKLIRTEKLTLLDEVRERVEQSLPDTTFLGTSIRVKDNIRDDGYHDGVRDSRLSIEEELTKLEAEL